MNRAAVRCCVGFLTLLAACKAYDASLLETRAATSVKAGNNFWCTWQVDLCNGEDDDCDGIIDEQGTDTCAALHAHTRCQSGACVLSFCEEGYADCNDHVNDGCEHTIGDPSCGRCGEFCDASTPPDAAGEPPMSEEPPKHDAGREPPKDDELDDAGSGGSDPDPDPEDAGPNDSACIQKHPTGQGVACDRCVCERCGADLARCVGTEDPSWNEVCGAYLSCAGEHIALGECPQSDCVSGSGPCASTYFATVARFGASCATDPIAAPCGAVRQLRTQCYLITCAAACKG